MSTSEERLARVNLIVEAFNDVTFDRQGAVSRNPVYHHTPAHVALLQMINDKRSEYDTMGKKITLALEVSQIVANIGTPAARQYFHRVLQVL